MDSELFTKEHLKLGLYKRLNDDVKNQTNTILKLIESKNDDIQSPPEERVYERNKIAMPVDVLAGRVRSEESIRILRAKIKVLREQFNTLQSDYAKRTDEWKSLQGDVIKAEEISMKNKQNALQCQDQVKKQEKLIATITGHLQIRDRENSILRKQIESLKRELKQQEVNSNGNEVRLNRSLEEIEKLKDALKKLQHKEKELKDTFKTKEDELSALVSRAEKQKEQVIASFKKQLYFINNLKKQQSALETSHLMSIAEEEFIKLLDWSPGLVMHHGSSTCLK